MDNVKNRSKLLSEIEIDYLRFHPDAIPSLAQYSYDEWRPVYDAAGLSYVDALNSYQERVNTDKLPMALVARHLDKTVGTGSLKIQDLDIRPAYTPWLGGMYVLEEYRGRGIGNLLIEGLLEKAIAMGLVHLYLWTPFSESLYKRYGWKSIERVNYCSYQISIMYRDIVH